MSWGCSWQARAHDPGRLRCGGPCTAGVLQRLEQTRRLGHLLFAGWASIGTGGARQHVGWGAQGCTFRFLLTWVAMLAAADAKGGRDQVLKAPHMRANPMMGVDYGCRPEPLEHAAGAPVRAIR